VKLCTANSEDCFFGELALLYDAPRAATVKVASEEAKLALLDRASFKYIMQVFRHSHPPSPIPHPIPSHPISHPIPSHPMISNSQKGEGTYFHRGSAPFFFCSTSVYVHVSLRLLFLPPRRPSRHVWFYVPLSCLRYRATLGSSVKKQVLSC
jgi:hypothetical protein